MPIIGNGNLAKVLTDNPLITWFASGVSNSSCISEDEYTREMLLLLNQPKEIHLVYFSSLSTYTVHNRYNRHKIQMEELVKKHFKSYTIVRIGVIEWGTNPTTIQNYFRAKIKNNEKVHIENVYRSVLSLEEFKYWMSIIPVGRCNEMNITGKLMTAQEIYDQVKEGKL